MGVGWIVDVTYGECIHVRVSLVVCIRLSERLFDCSATSFGGRFVIDISVNWIIGMDCSS